MAQCLKGLAALFILTCLPVALLAATISGTVRDSSGAVVPAAQITIQSAANPPIPLSSDEHGAFASPDLPPGHYQVQVRHGGFDDLTQAVELTSSPAILDLKLAIAAQRQEITVTGKGGTYANSDPFYRQLREIGLGKSFSLEDSTIAVDAGTFLFRQGTVTFLAPVDGVVTGAVFVGSGHFTLTPATAIDRAELQRRCGADVFEEDFTQIVFRFTNGANHQFLAVSKGAAETPDAAPAVMQHWETVVRHRNEQPLGYTEAVLDDEVMDNVDADILASLYNHNQPVFFSAYLKGNKHKDLRFFLRTRGGAIPQVDSPEEVALVNFAPESLDDGIWYQAHRKVEFQRGTARSDEERRFFTAKSFVIETVIGNNDHLTSVATIELEPLVPGERVAKFHLLPNLRVSRVSDPTGRDLFYIQESRKADGSFYVIFPQGCELGKTYRSTVEYAGDKVIAKAGEGSFYIGARECWYPTPNSFGEHSKYDLTFRVPKKYKLVSVGALEKESIEDNLAVTHWVTKTPIAIAGFNFGEYKKAVLVDEQTKSEIEGYYLTALPDFLRDASALQSLAPGAMTRYALQVTRAELQICNYYFGSNGFDRLYITEQPNFNFGQSWPNLVYLPISAYMDSTQRYLLMGGIKNKLTAFVQEVTPHEVSHQWWGHAVSWASYHDQWLSEGFAEFSAALFVQQGQGPDWHKDYTEFWSRLQREILEKNEFGAAPNDAGPLWLGTRLSSPRNQSAYQYLTYPKGAYVLEMLRSLMYSNADGDKEFINMMHEFVATHRDRPASTETFKAVAEKHMNKSMDFGNNGKLDWFFNEWVYGTEVPKYAFAYNIERLPGGHAKVSMTLTQSEVDDKFVMAVPIFADMGKGKLVRIGQLPVQGNSTRSVSFDLTVLPKAVEANPFKEVLQR